MKFRLPKIRIDFRGINDLERSVRPILSAIGVSGVIETSTINALGDELAKKDEITDYQLRMLQGIVRRAVSVREDQQMASR